MSAIPPDRSSARTIAIALVLGTLGAALFLVLPGFVDALKRLYGFSEVELGYLSSSHLIGMTLGTALGAQLIARLGMRKAAGRGLLLAALSNAGAFLVHQYRPLLALIFMSGLGAGVAIAVCFVVLGGSAQVDRNFSLYNITQMVFGAAALEWMPAISDQVGIGGVFASLAVLFAASMLLARQLPAATQTTLDQVNDKGSSATAWIALGAIGVFFAAQCLVWTYLELMGQRHGLSQQTVASSVALSSLLALVGPASVVLIGSRWGRLAPLSAGLLISLSALFLLRTAANSSSFTIGACLFNFAWNLSSCYLPAIVATSYTSGRAMRWVAFSTLAGVAVGPFIGAIVVGATGIDGVIGFGAALCVLSFMGFMPAFVHRARVVS